ncbi:MAG TPA: hypothetical protein VF508_06235 [Pyrinomonadaceae bacterium]
MRVNILRSLRLLTLALLFVMGFGATRALAQDAAATPTPTPESEETRRLREQKANAELRRDIAAAEKAELESKSPKPTTTPLAGTTTINEGAVIESEMISYLSMAYAANRIVERLTNLDAAQAPQSPRRLPINSLAIYNKADVDLLLNYRAVNSQLDILRLEFCRRLPPGTPNCPTAANQKVTAAALPIISSFLGSIVDMTALLRTDVVIQGHTFNVDEASLVSEVFRALRANDGYTERIKLYYPAVFPPNLNADDKSELLGVLEELNGLKSRLNLQTRPLEDLIKRVVKLKSDIADLDAFVKTSDAQIKAAGDELDRLEKLRDETQAKGWRVPFDVLERIQKLRDNIVKIRQKQLTAPGELLAKKAELTALQLKEPGVPADPDDDKLEDALRARLAVQKSVVERFDQMVANFTKTDAATGINALTAYLRAEQLRSALGGDNSYWLQLSVVKAGGNNRIKKNLLVDIFTGGSRLSHSGGVIVQYNLYDPAGKSVVSDTLTEYTGYTKAGRIKRLINPAKVEDIPPRIPAHP